MLETGSYNGVNFAKEVCFTGENETKVFIYNVDGLLIDCGPQSRAEQFIPWMKEQEIKQVALTHNHEDHSGNAKWIRDELKIPVYLHPLAIPLTRERGAYPLYRQEMWGHREVFDATPMPEKLKTDKYAFDVIDSPGHALYHKCFHEANQKWLFTGDLYLGTRLLVCFIEENMRQTISTIERLMDLDFDTIFCAHAGLRPTSACGWYPVGQQEIYEYEASGGSRRGLLHCRLTSFPQRLQTNLRMNLDTTESERIYTKQRIIIYSGSTRAHQ